METAAYEMKYTDAGVPQSDIVCIPFEAPFLREYMRIYNECFYDMRKALDIRPYHFLHDYRQISDKAQAIYLLTGQREIIGSVGCYGNEIDDLIVNPQFQGRGYGKQLLLWGMNRIRERNSEPITLHVAGWNHRALRLYQKVGFKISKAERIR